MTIRVTLPPWPTGAAFAALGLAWLALALPARGEMPAAVPEPPPLQSPEQL